MSDHDQGLIDQLITYVDTIANLRAELHRWQHGTQIEGDYICEPAAENQHLRDEVERLKAQLATKDAHLITFAAVEGERNSLIVRVTKLCAEVDRLNRDNDYVNRMVTALAFDRKGQP